MIFQTTEGDPKHSKVNKMKRQRNMQQMEKHAKNPQDQTNEKDMGSLPEKGFRVMIVKMIQILKIKWRQKIAWRHGSRRCKKCLTRT